MDIDSVKKAINPATKAIVLVHYAGMACDPENFRQLADEHNLLLIEDAAHAIGASYRGKWLGSYGDFATFSFHETKNIHCGHGGMLIVNRADQEQEALEIWHHGTDRLSFEKKEKSFYAWTRPGGSFVMPELNAAFLYPQLLQLSEINAGRMKRWQLYYELLHPLEIEGVFKLPDRMSRSSHNAHIFYLLTPNEKVRNHLLKYLYDNDILAVFHYIPLHLSTFGKTLNEKNDLLFSERIANRIVRLPLYDSISNETILHITDLIHQWSVIHSAKKRFGKFENQ
jgi:dTDP-4-amino-4,6-dideoxygalactose transaminase